MRRIIRNILVAVVMCLLSGSYLFADTSGAAFLQIGDGARPLALGGAYTAGSGSVDSIYYNPAGLATLDDKEMSITHSDWLEGMSFDVASYGQSTAYGTFAISALRLGGTQDGRDANRQETGSFSTDDMSFLLSYSHLIGSMIGVGTNLKYLRSTIGIDKASTYALDFGAIARTPGQRLSFGASVLNIGSGLQFIDQTDHLPLTLAVGAACQPINPLQLTLDFKHQPHDQFSEVDAGAEYWIGPFALRAGYAAPVEGTDTSLDAMEYFRGGIGLKVSRFRADYTLAPYGDLGLTQRFTLSVLFGEQAGSGQPRNLQPHALQRADPQQIAALFEPL
jgi:hypothetical protein